MTPLVNLGGNDIPFGMDDVVDYLAQYGVVSTPGKSDGWLSDETLSVTHHLHALRLYFSMDEDIWTCSVYTPDRTNEKYCHYHLDQAVAHYLTLKGKYVRS